MVTLTCEQQLNYVSANIDETDMVDDRYEYDLIDSSEIRGQAPDENGIYPVIVQWRDFKNFGSVDYERLTEANIPVWF